MWYDGEEIDTLSVSGGTAGHESHFYYPVGGVFTASKVSQYPNTQYSNGVDLQNLTGNKFTNVFVWKCVNTTDRCNHIMLGGEYNSIAEALVAKLPSIIPDVITKQGKFVGRIVIGNGQSVASQITSELTNAIGQTPVTDHNNLSNIQGGTTNEYNHLTNAQVGKVDSLETTYSPTGHTHYQLHQPDGTNPFVYTDNGGNLHIDGNIYQSGSTYETHAEQVYTSKDDIILRDGASAGLSTGEFAGFTIKNYDGAHDGSLKIDKDGWMRVGDVGQEQKLATIEESTLDNYLMKYNASTFRLEGINPTSLPVSTASDLKYVNQDGGTTWHKYKVFTPQTGQTASSSGTTVTITNPIASFQFTSGMVGYKFGFGSERRLITGYISTSQITVESAFSINYSGITSTGWGVYSLHTLYSTSGSYPYTEYGYNGAVLYQNDLNGFHTFSGLGVLLGGTEFKNNVINGPTSFKINWSSTSVYYETPDTSIYRPSAGRLKIYNGVTTTERRDLELRNLYADNIYNASGSTLYTKEDGGTIWHPTKWFTPNTGQTASSSGTTVTITNPTTNFQFLSTMVGSKFGFGTDKRIITAYISTTQVTVESAFSQNYSGQSEWGVYSIFSDIVGNYYTTYNTSYTTMFQTYMPNKNSTITGELSLGTGGSCRITSSEFKLTSGYKLLWSSVFDGNGTKDTGLYRPSAGLFQIYDGVTTSNLRDLKLRTLYTDSIIPNNSTTGVIVSGTTSGSTVFNVQGTTGDLLKVTDVVSDSLLDVVDTTNRTIFSVVNDGSIKQNSISVSGMTTGTTNVMVISKTSCNALFFDYFVKETGTSAYRSGTVMCVQDGTNVSYTDNSTPDLNASTNGITLSTQISSGNVVLVATITSGTYNISCGVRKI